MYSLTVKRHDILMQRHRNYLEVKILFVHAGPLKRCTDHEQVMDETLILDISINIYPEFFGTRVGCHVSAVEWV